MINKEIEQKLKEPFAQSDVDFRIARVFKNNQKAVVLAYITSRAVMDRLDEVIGIDNWTDNYQVLANGVVCDLSVRINDEWISKQDTAPFTNVEALKGGFSNALKRAAVKFGIGRYLYSLPQYYVELVRDRPYHIDDSRVHNHYSKEVSGYWVEPNLPSWAVKSEIKNEGNNQKNQPELGNANSDYDDADDLPVSAPTEINYVSVENLPNDRGSLQVILLEYVRSLIEQNALTDKKKSEYLAKINQSDVSVGLLKYFYRQFTLIDKLYSLKRTGSLTEDERVEIYRSIMRANNNNLNSIEQTLNQKAA